MLAAIEREPFGTLRMSALTHGKLLQGPAPSADPARFEPRLSLLLLSLKVLP